MGQLPWSQTDSSNDPSVSVWGTGNWPPSLHSGIWERQTHTHSLLHQSSSTRGIVVYVCECLYMCVCFCLWFCVTHYVNFYVIIKLVGTWNNNNYTVKQCSWRKIWVIYVLCYDFSVGKHCQWQGFAFFVSTCLHVSRRSFSPRSKIGTTHLLAICALHFKSDFSITLSNTIGIPVDQLATSSFTCEDRALKTVK